MSVPAPDPGQVRIDTVEQLERLGLPVPPPSYPLVWEPGDEVELRPRVELEARCAVINVVLAHAFGMPGRDALAWLEHGGLIDQVTPPEYNFLAHDEGDVRSFALHTEALAALGWLLTVVRRLDPAAPGAENIANLFPNLPAGEAYRDWQARVLTAPRDPRLAAATLDLYYCLDWSYLKAEESQLALPGYVDSNAIGQRRWALEWAVTFHGPFHEDPPGWEEVDLST
ncbi:DUF4272 domain-containing protein [Rugosimonospora africana]|uniref:DUF4272 domain-containing protein n=1 Tax=Rugosimonospora africana TaxID=556532 RepID=A0A8J3QKF7_9ACTN|nr:DUF4272 domain-containing protein [Rugosimonospora africana]GIH12615.1 hypothetical protein Raf01_07870 [Rugosimonospora africana]